MTRAIYFITANKVALLFLVKVLFSLIFRILSVTLPATTEDFARIGMFKGLINRVDLSQYVNFWSIATSVLGHFGPYPLRSFLRGPNWQRTEVTKDRSGCPDQYKDRSGERQS